MQFLPLRSVFIASLLFLGACQFGTRVAGSVTDAVSHRPISNATVRLYRYETNTAPSGCFSLDGTAAEPSEFSVSAPGYKPVVVNIVPGVYQASVTLVPDCTTGTARRNSGRFCPGNMMSFPVAARRISIGTVTIRAFVLWCIGVH